MSRLGDRHVRLHRPASATTQRRAEPHKLVALGGRWYLVAHDRDRLDWRSFRVDRISDPAPTGQHFRPRDLPAESALVFVTAGIRRMPQRYAVRVRLDMPAAELHRAVGRWGTVTADGCLLVMNVDSLGWPAMVLVESGAEFTVESPPELADLLAESAARFTRAVAPRVPNLGGSHGALVP
jgi:predicted DNA-binding transcriptional regulator YafY